MMTLASSSRTEQESDMENQFGRYLRASEEWVDPDTDPELIAFREESGMQIIGNVRANLLVAEGGPFDGESIDVPSNGSIVILPAAYGKTGDMQGKVIYEKRGNKMVYIGQPDQTDADHTDEDEDAASSLILPS
jgi:hypothetical protein